MDLPVAVGSLAGFIILGELEMLVGVGQSTHSPALVYLPVSPMPTKVLTGRSVCEGAARYWAPHLPALAGAMGELLWRVVEIRGSVDPAVIIYRGEDVIVFMRTGELSLSELSVLFLSREVDTEGIEVTRHAAVVQPLPMPGYIPHHVPQPAPTRIPVPAGS